MTLTIGTDQPVYPPWYVDDDPTSGMGFESAVAYAIAVRARVRRRRRDLGAGAVQRRDRAGTQDSA